MIINRFPSFMPPRFRTTCTFAAQPNMLHTGFAYSNIRYSLSNAFDIDPTTGSTAMPGYSELSQLYRRYRIVSSHVWVAFVNGETFAGTCYVCPVNADPTANASQYQSFISNPLCREAGLGAITGTSRAVLQITASPEQFGGSADTLTDDSYSALVNAAPVNGIWVAIGFYNQTGSQTTGISLSVRIKTILDFYEFQTPST